MYVRFRNATPMLVILASSPKIEVGCLRTGGGGAEAKLSGSATGGSGGGRIQGWGGSDGDLQRRATRSGPSYSGDPRRLPRAAAAAASGSYSGSRGEGRITAAGVLPEFAGRRTAREEEEGEVVRAGASVVRRGRSERA